MDLQHLSGTLLQTLNPTSQKQAESRLEVLEKDYRMVGSLIKIVADPNSAQSVRLSGILYLKNMIKRYWQLEKSSVLDQNNRSLLKSQMIEMIHSVPSNIQVHVSDIVSIMASYDFPDDWPELLPLLVSQLSLGDLFGNNGILQTIHSITKRYRHEFRSDQLWTEINAVLAHLASPMLQLYKVTDEWIDRNSGNQGVLAAGFNSLLLLNKIFYSLSSQDIPEFFEDNLTSFVAIFDKYLNYFNPLVSSNVDSEPGILEKVQTSICEILYLYCQRYEEEFGEIPRVVEKLLGVLSVTPLAVKYDRFVGAALGVITIVAKKPEFTQLFDQQDTLQILCEKIVISNIMIRESDEEQFDNEPLDYVRGEMEGLEIESRRRSAEELIRALMQLHGAKIKQILLWHISRLVKEYSAHSEKSWKAKCTAIHLFMAISIQSYNLYRGATSIYETCNIVEFFAENVCPHLNGSGNSMLIADSIRYCLVFRHQMPQEMLLSVFALMVDLLTHRHVVVYSYASVFVDRTLDLKQNGQLLFGHPQLASIGEGLVTRLLSILNPHQQALVEENEFVLRPVLRFALRLDRSCSGISQFLFGKSVLILSNLVGRSMNPSFSYYLFELVVQSLKLVCLDRQYQNMAIGQLLPVVQKILQEDVSDFVPYALIVASVLIECAGGDTVPAETVFLFEPLLQPGLWLNQANVPALLRLLESFIVKNPTLLMDTPNHLLGVLGLFQMFITSKLHDHYGFELVRILILKIPIGVLEPYINPIMTHILNRAQTCKTPKFRRCFFVFVCHFMCFGTLGRSLAHILDDIQPGLFRMVVESYVLGDQSKIVHEKERKIVSVGLSNMVGNTQIVDMLGELWIRVLDKLVQVISNVPPPDGEVVDEELVSDSGSGKLKSAPNEFVYCQVDTLPDPKHCLAQAWSHLSTQRPHVKSLLVNCSPLTEQYMTMLQ